MRLLALLLLIPAFSHGATATFLCWDGNYWTGTDSTSCPAHLTAASGGSTISDTTANVSVTSTTDSGTLYAGVKPTVSAGVCPAAPSRAEFIAGTGTGGYIGSSDATPQVGTNEVAITGLTASDEYCSYHLQIDDQGRPSANNTEIATYIATSDAWSTLSGAPSGSDLETFNARFVGTGGSNSNDGLTHATRWLNTTPATSLPSGTDVYLLAGTDNGERSFTINWSGSSSDRVIVGCYYDDGGQMTSCHEGAGADAQTLPIIQGTYNYEAITCMITKVCRAWASGDIPASSSALVNVGAQQWVALQDLNIRQSAGRCIGSSETGTAGRLLIQRNTIEYCRESAILLNNLATGSRPIIRDNTLHGIVMKFGGPGVGLQSSSKARIDALVEGNTMKYMFGEGLNLLRATGAIYRENVLSDVTRPIIYLDNGAEAVVEHNIVVGDQDWATNPSGPAIAVQVEGDYPLGQTQSSTGNVIRNNLIANTLGGVWITVTTDIIAGQVDTVRELGFKSGARVMGNTILQDNGDLFRINVGTDPANLDFSSWHNNISVAGGLQNCSSPAWTSTYFTSSHNAYDNLPADTDCRGTDTQTTATPTLNTTADTDTMPTVASFRVAAASAAVNNGLVQTTAILDIADYPQYADVTGTLCLLSEANWVKELYADYECVTRGASVTIGALETTAP